MTTTPPILREWSGLKPPVICTVEELSRMWKKEIFQVYWLMTIRPIDNVITESHPMKVWSFIADGRLIGEIDTGYGGWQRTVELNPDEYVVVSLK